VLEKRIAFALEISTLVVRGANGALAFYDCPANTHEGGILRRSVVPAGLPATDLAKAREIAAAIADALGYVGVLAVEDVSSGDRRAPFGPPDGQRDRTARAQQRPLDHRGVWHQPVREPHSRGGRAGRSARPTATAMPRWST